MPKIKRSSDFCNPDEDPLTQAMAPPPDETPKAREIRLAEEAEAQRRSDAIDEEINKQRQAERRAPKCIRILLLGVCAPSSNPVIHSTLVCRPERIWYVPLLAQLL
jgi:guanine nucleotide-binding protein subunit alpha